MQAHRVNVVFVGAQCTYDEQRIEAMACKFLFKFKRRIYSTKNPDFDIRLWKVTPDLQIVCDSWIFFISKNKLLEPRDPFWLPSELFRQLVLFARSLGNLLVGLNLVLKRLLERGALNSRPAKPGTTLLPGKFFKPL